jgi:hypothetical protein
VGEIFFTVITLIVFGTETPVITYQAFVSETGIGFGNIGHFDPVRLII